MNVLPIFFIGFSVCWYALQSSALFKMSSASRLQRLLAYIFIWWGLSTLKDLLLYIPHTDTQAILQHIYFIDGFGAVSFAFILFELTMPDWLTLKRVVALSLPFLTFFIANFFVASEWFTGLFTVFFVIFAWTAFLVGLYKGRQYAHAIRENYSNLEDVDISWIWGILVAFFICQHVWWAVSDTLNSLADSFYYASSLVCWHFTLQGINRLRPLRLSNPDDATVCNSDELNDRLPSVAEKRVNGMTARLEQLMENERLYLNPTITLNDLAAHIGTNRTYMSDYFSTELGTTFYDYINRQRIERSVLPLMQADPSLSFEQIAAQSGFNSISTFRRAFLKLTGQLPSEYIKQKHS